MKAKFGLLALALSITFLYAGAQRRVVTTTRAMSYDISDNLDLDAVASIFGDSKDLEDFEYRLNDPDNRISNLDLNEDGYIDYLRVVENSDDHNSLVVIQAVLDADIYQDVATIEIERVQNGRLRVQIIGDSYIYGSNYIIEPVFVRTPVIFSFFWSSHYRPYYSPYYWNYYPRWYSYYTPYPTYRYHRHIHHHINYHNTYHRTSERYVHFSEDRYNHVRRSDYASRYPDRSFSKRQSGYSNKYELEKRRPTNISSSDRRRNTGGSINNRSYENKSATIGRNNNRTGNTYENRRSSTNVNSGGSNTSRTRSENKENVNRNRSNKTSNPEFNSGSRSGSDRTYTRENRNVVNNRTTAPESKPVHIKSGNTNSSGNGSSVSRNRSMPTSSPNRSGNQVDSRTSTPRERSGSVISNSNRTNREVKQQNSGSSRSSKSEEKKESGNGRRR